MSEQDNGKVATLHRPTTNDLDAWKAYWKAHGQPWRTEPEIDAGRQKYLSERRAILPNIEKGIYPFKDIKLYRADVEWLLATHENGRGPVDWSDEKQKNREGLDLRGADLSQEDLSGLPLARMQGGLAPEAKKGFDKKQANIAAAHLKNANLDGAQLQGAILNYVQLQEASLRRAKLQKAYLHGAQLQEADFDRAEMQEADFEWTNMQEADFHGAQLQKASLGGANLQNASLHSAKLQGVFLCIANLDGIDLRLATIADKTYGAPVLADVRWGEINLAVIDWTSVKMLGDERLARQSRQEDGRVKDKEIRLMFYKRAIRANRQLAVVLRGQGLNEEADRFAYRAQKLHRIVLRHQKKFGSYFFSLFLDLLAGYGYRPGRSVAWYFITILGFALGYFLFGHLPVLPDALVFSLTSFHGRGFFPGLGNENSLHNPLVIMAAFEAVIGLLIEISFIATFTQRFFGK